MAASVTHAREPRWLLRALVLLLVAVGLMLLGVQVRAFEQEADAQRVHLVGQVSYLAERTSKSGSGYSSSYAPHVRFTTPEGEEHGFTHWFSTSPPSYEVGERVAVVYDPGEPDTARIDSALSRYWKSLVVFVSGGCLLLIAVITVIVALRAPSRAAKAPGSVASLSHLDGFIRDHHGRVNATHRARRPESCRGREAMSRTHERIDEQRLCGQSLQIPMLTVSRLFDSMHSIVVRPPLPSSLTCIVTMPETEPGTWQVTSRQPPTGTGPDVYEVQSTAPVSS